MLIEDALFAQTHEQSGAVAGPGIKRLRHEFGSCRACRIPANSSVGGISHEGLNGSATCTASRSPRSAPCIPSKAITGSGQAI